MSAQLSMKQDKRVQIRIDIDGSRMPDKAAELAPGSTVSGMVEMIPNQDINIKSAELQLRWQTIGKGDMDFAVIDKRSLAGEGVLSSGITINDSFSFTLPDKPWSFNGHYVNIVWSIHVHINIPGLKRDVHFDAPFILNPDAAPSEESIW